MAKKKRLKAIDLFAGAGGLSLGLELAGIDVVGAVEHCPKAVETYKHNFPTTLRRQNARTLQNGHPKKWKLSSNTKMELTKEDIDIIAGGPPCPGFSNIGRSKIISLLLEGGLDRWSWGDEKAEKLRHTFIQDPRNELFLEFVKYVEHFEPRWFIMENVPGMLTSKIEGKKGVLKIVDVVQKAFRDIGYECEVKPFGPTITAFPDATTSHFSWGGKIPTTRFHTLLGTSKKDITSVQAIDDLPFMGQNGGRVCHLWR